MPRENLSPQMLNAAKTVNEFMLDIFELEKRMILFVSNNPKLFSEESVEIHLEEIRICVDNFLTILPQLHRSILSSKR